MRTVFSVGRFSLLSRRKHKAWGVSPRYKSHLGPEPARAGESSERLRLSPALAGCEDLVLWILGLTPQALCLRLLCRLRAASRTFCARLRLTQLSPRLRLKVSTRARRSRRLFPRAAHRSSFPEQDGPERGRVHSAARGRISSRGFADVAASGIRYRLVCLDKTGHRDQSSVGLARLRECDRAHIQCVRDTPTAVRA